MGLERVSCIKQSVGWLQSESSRSLSLWLFSWGISVSQSQSVTTQHRCLPHHLSTVVSFVSWEPSFFLPHSPSATLHLSLPSTRSPLCAHFLCVCVFSSLLLFYQLIPVWLFFHHHPLCASLCAAAAPSWQSSLCRINASIICQCLSALSFAFIHRPSVIAG